MQGLVSYKQISFFIRAISITSYTKEIDEADLTIPNDNQQEFSLSGEKNDIVTTDIIVSIEENSKKLYNYILRRCRNTFWIKI